MTEEQVGRNKQILIAAVILGTITVFVLTLLIGWRYVPGLFGEWLGVIAGLLSTPFLLEGSFVVLGLMIVVGLNSWRRMKEGEEFVYLDQVEGPGAEELPDQARWAVYHEKPLPPSTVSLLELAEGAVAIGDFESAAAAVAAMSHEELAADGVLEVRLALAEAGGKADLADRLRGAIKERG
ncbi:hypothetical protein OVA24_08615 [Luteolibacter sp. SL250]|uniref:hypothetical protein n=1 Tax=Luteolibacter sp. SL250 TaxID=2995170 RepID=UPI00226E1232|nr:hypothetical protein [Luteolibacter sp. SL250]WAC21447.1 hypothetical protein OVA24_08615 [Luteolibacter sp. SL250]